MRLMRGSIFLSIAAATLLASACYGGAAPSTSPFNPPVSIGQGSEKMPPMNNALTGVDQIPTPGPLPGFSIGEPAGTPPKLVRGANGLFQQSLGLPSIGAAVFRESNFHITAPQFKIRIHG